MKIAIAMIIGVMGVAAAAGAQSQSAASRPASCPQESLPNDQVGIDIDRFIGSPSASAVRVTREAVLTQSILRAGDPHAPGDPGAVMPYHDDFAVGKLLPNTATPLLDLPQQQMLYIESGSGRLDDGALYWDLRPGIGILIPAGLRHRLSNTADEPLTMLMLTWKNLEGITPRKDILVRDVNLLPFTERGAHWNYTVKQLFYRADGLHPNERVLVVYVPPLSMGSPHAHPPNWQEVWTNIGPESSFLMLGSELREMPVNTGFISPPNNQTTHAVLNMSKEKIQSYFYFARYTMVWPADSGGSEGTVAGKPLSDQTRRAR